MFSSPGCALIMPCCGKGALALLVVTIAKVFVFDTAQLDGAERAGSFLALGLLLLAGAFAWQRTRPRVEA